MSSKQVPEVNQLPITEQMQRLETWVCNHRKLFEKYRGGNKLYDFSQFGFITPDKTISPTANLKWFDELTGDIRILLNIQATLHRDGCSVAAEALYRALMHKDRWDQPVKLPFEDCLPTEKEPMVLLMFEPEKVFPIMRWFRNAFMELDALWEEDKNIRPREDTLSVAQILPSLRKHWEDNQHCRGPHHNEVFKAIADDILSKFDGVQDWFDSRPCMNPVAAMYTGSTYESRLHGEHGVYAHNAYDGVAFAYLLRGIHQRDVLKHIPRSLQGAVATWQFEVYEKTWFGIPHHQVMFIPEDELKYWQGICQSSLSKGVAAGYVAVYNPEEVFQSLPDGKLRDMKSTLFINNR